MDYFEWKAEFKPIINHMNNSASMDGCLFHFYGEEWNYVQQFQYDCIWSLIVTDLDNGKTSWDITNGIHVINREGFLMTEKQCLEDMEIHY